MCLTHFLVIAYLTPLSVVNISGAALAMLGVVVNAVVATADAKDMVRDFLNSSALVIAESEVLNG